jgi:sugar lactone lactonase YvrE
MKANLMRSLGCLLSVCFALGFAARPAGAGAPAGQISALTITGPAQTNASGDSKIEVENWAKPEPGWLYVLDPKPDAGGPGGRVWLIDPETGKVMGSIRTGDNADFALSPDGSRLYVASITEGDSSELAAIDTAQGTVLQRGLIEDREVANVLPAFSTMAVSGDGLALRIL